MNAERFQTLAEAYGGSISRWPADQQDAAWAFLAEDPDAADNALAEARRLDETLDGWRPPTPSGALRRRILTTAPHERAAPNPLRRWLLGAGAGVGLAMATVTGVLVGVELSAAGHGDADIMLAAVYGGDPLDAPGAPS